MDSEEGDEQKDVKPTEWIFTRETGKVIAAVPGVRGSVPGIQL